MLKKIILLFTILLNSNLFGQPKFKVDFDFARFFYDDSTGYVEIYYSFYQPGMRRQHSNSGNFIRGVLKVSISDKLTDNLLINKTYQFDSAVEDSTDSNPSKSLIGVLSYGLSKGEYTCKLIASDGFEPINVDSVSIDISFKLDTSKTFYTSDIELANSILPSNNDGTSPFYKNSYDVIPNPSGIYGEKMPVVFYYSELYDLQKDIGEKTLKIDYVLLDSKGNSVYTKRKQYPRTFNSIVDVGTINISKIPTGSYALVQILSDSIKNVSYITSKKLFIFNPSAIDTSQSLQVDNDVLSSEFNSMSEEEIDEKFNQSKYIATDEELKQWERLNSEESKKKFLFEFWKSRKSNPEYPGKDFKREYFDRVKYANDHFSTIQRKGWLTDRGRIYITYGEPSEIQRFPNEADTKPYEVWEYHNIEGGVLFVFADLTGFSEYVLIHSTKRGEFRDDSWQRKIYVQ